VPEILQLLVSPRSHYAGRSSAGAAPFDPADLVERAEVRAGLGLVGDRYFGKPAHRRAAVTIMAVESLERLHPPLLLASLAQARRNVLLRGADVDSWIAATVSLDSGFGPVEFAVHRPANPCAWMDVTIGAGAMAALRGHGGVRCEPLTDGVLTVGPVVIEVSPAG
jgi:MOSC domain-containing protein YiiM